MKRALRLGLGLALFAAVLWWLDASWADVRARARFGAAGLGFSFAGTALASLVTAARWKLLAEAMGGTPLALRIYVHALVITRLIGQFTSTMAMDLVGRGVALRAGGSRRDVGHAMAQVVVERMFDLLLPAALALWALLARDDAGALAAALGVFALVGMVVYRPLVRLAVRVYARLRRRVVPDETETLAPALQPTLGVAIVTLSIARFASVVLQFWGVAWAVGLDLDVIQTTAATVFAQLTGILGVTPGGLGIVEIGWAGGLELVGLDATGIALFVIAQRVVVVSSFAILSGVGAATFGRSNVTDPRPDEAPPPRDD